MASTQELLEQARALGEAIASHPHVQAFMKAKARTEADSDAQRVLGDYQKQVQRIRKLETEQKPIEVGDKRKMAECEQAMASNDALKELMRTQADYVALMNQINRAMETPLAGAGKSGEAN
jgi:cell fate (sporulation/competence/biofilm development) regulator YlbF (YheA/YmcA/DUF963 family)